MSEIPERLRLSTGKPNTDELLLAINAALREIRTSIASVSGAIESVNARVAALEAAQPAASELTPTLSSTPVVTAPASASSSSYGRPWSSGFGLGYEGAEFLYGWSGASRPSAFGTGFSGGMRN